jgi:threonine aldolase
VDALREAIRPYTRHHMGTALVWMENTHNRSGGAVLPLAHMRAVYGLAREKGVPVHLDGARIFNAAISLGCAGSEISKYSDSVCFCVSKGLSARYFAAARRSSSAPGATAAWWAATCVRPARSQRPASLRWKQW